MTRKSKKLFAPLVALAFIFGVMVTGAWADPTKMTVTGDPGGTGTQPVANDMVSPSGALVSAVSSMPPLSDPSANNIIITEQAAGDLSIGSTIVVTSPAGTVFDLGTVLPSVRCKDKTSNTGSSLRVNDTTTIFYQTVNADYSADASTLTLLTKAASTTVSYVEMGGIRLVPTTAARTAETNTSNLPFTVAVQVSGKSFEVGQVDLLGRPRIVSAVKSGNTTVDVTFNVPVAATTRADENNFYVDPGSGTSAKPTTATSLSSTSTRLTGATWVGTGYPNVVLQNSNRASIQNLESSGVLSASDGNDKAYAPVPIKSSSSSSITSVSIDNQNDIATLAGGKIGVQALAGNSAMPMNTFTVTVNATAGEAYKLKIIRKAGSTYGRNGPMSVTNLTIGGAVTALETALATNANTTADNEDIFWVSGSQNTGTVALTIVAGGKTGSSNVNGFNAAGSTIGGYAATYVGGITTGDETQIMVLASQDNFTDYTASGYITVDKKAPSVIQSGASKAVALSRKSVRLTWNEDMDVSTLGSAGKWQIKDITNTSNIPVTGVTVDADSRTVTLTTTGSFPSPGNVQAAVNSGLAVLSGIEDVCGNLAVGPGADAWTSVTSTDIPVPIGDLMSVTGAPGAYTGQIGQTGLSNGASGMVVTITGDPALPLSNIWLQGVDGGDESTAQGTKKQFSTLTGAMESSAGVFTANSDALLYSSITSTSIKLRAITSTSATGPTSWTAAVLSGALVVDNSGPKVTTASYDAVLNAVTLNFDMVMNGTSLNAILNYNVASTVGDSVDVMNILSISSDKKSVTVDLIESLDATKTYYIDVVQGAASYAGVPISYASNTYGVDRAIIGTATTLALDQSTASMAVGGTGFVQISGGTTPYVIGSNSDTSVVTATIQVDKVILSGVAVGTATIVVEDSSTPVPQQALLDVTVAVATPVGKDPGPVAETVAPATELALYLNITNTYGNLPADIAQEWLTFQAIVGGVASDLFFWNTNGLIITYATANADPQAATYAFDHTSDTLNVIDVSLGAIGMTAGDILWYGYAYSLTALPDLSDLSGVVFDNFVHLTVQ